MSFHRSGAAAKVGFSMGSARNLTNGNGQTESNNPLLGAELDVILLYQPKASLSTGTIEGVEALIRWQHSNGSLIGPDMFIPLAEKTGLMRDLTLTVADETFKQTRKWMDAGKDFHVAMNLSVENITDQRLPIEIEDLLVTWGVPGSKIHMEVTENGIMSDPDRSLGVLQRLTDLGIRIAIDDFGAGHSSLSRLRQMPASELKIDRSFVTNMLADESSATIVRSIIDLGRRLGLRVVAEGVETEDVWNELVTLGCDSVQGYFVARPLTSSELDEWMVHWRAPGSETAELPTLVKNQTRLVVVEDHALVRQSLVRTIRAEEGFEVAGEAGNKLQALETIRNEKPDMVLLDIELPDGSGLDISKELQADFPDMRILFLTLRDDEATVRQALESGADGYVSKASNTEELLVAVRTVSEGGSYLGQDITRRVMNMASGKLTRRQSA